MKRLLVSKRITVNQRNGYCFRLTLECGHTIQTPDTKGGEGNYAPGKTKVFCWRCDPKMVKEAEAKGVLI